VADFDHPLEGRECPVCSETLIAEVVWAGDDFTIAYRCPQHGVQSLRDPFA
jgi:uncharacterized radical SAM superfamily Fe-S cluster-containing enzyme